jgi:tRNA modification GTPase
VRQLDGSLSRRLIELREAILDLEALIAYDIDFPEEDEGALPAERVQEGAARVLGALDALLATAHTGELIRDGAAVVIAGPPNAGKSSLFNALLGSARAIVTEIPGTTRDAIEAVVEVHGWPVRLVDTAGLRESTDTVERLGIEVSERWLESADLVLACADDARDLPEVVRRIASRTNAPVLPVRTKGDIPPATSGDPHHAAAGDLRVSASPQPGGDIISVSAATGAGLGALTSRISQLLTDTHADPAGEIPLLTRERHRVAVVNARDEVARFQQKHALTSIPAIIAAVHLHSAAGALEAVIGQIDVEDVLDRVFSSFCVGK